MKINSQFQFIENKKKIFNTQMKEREKKTVKIYVIHDKTSSTKTDVVSKTSEIANRLITITLN